MRSFVWPQPGVTVVAHIVSHIVPTSLVEPLRSVWINVHHSPANPSVLILASDNLHLALPRFAHSFAVYRSTPSYSLLVSWYSVLMVLPLVVNEPVVLASCAHTQPLPRNSSSVMSICETA